MTYKKIIFALGTALFLTSCGNPSGGADAPIREETVVNEEEAGQDSVIAEDEERSEEDGNVEESETGMFQKVMDFEKDKFWDEKHIVGTEYMPEEEEEGVIDAAVDYTNNWDDYWDFYMGNSDTGREVNLVGQTDGFKLYAVETGENERDMLIRTSDHSYILAEGIHCTSLHGVQPVIAEADYDQDGETELAVQIHIIHGTGVSVDSLFMADKASDGHWYLFQLLNEDYSRTLSEKRGSMKIEDKNYFKIGDRTIAVADPQIESEQGGSSWQDEVGSIVDMKCSAEAITLKAEFGTAPGNGQEYSGMYSYNLGNGISAEVAYHGDGEWELENMDYYNARLEEYVEGIVYYYLTGEVQRAETEYHVTFQLPEETVETCSITNISYDSDTLGNDSFRVDVDYTVDGMEEAGSMILYVRQLELPVLLDADDIYSIQTYDRWQIVDIMAL